MAIRKNIGESTLDKNDNTDINENLVHGQELTRASGGYRSMSIGDMNHGRLRDLANANPIPQSNTLQNIKRRLHDSLVDQEMASPKKMDTMNVSRKVPHSL